MALHRINFNLNRNGSNLTFLLDLDDSQYSQQIMLNYFRARTSYEPETSFVVEQLLQPGDTFLDIGGHVGFFSLFASALVGASGRVFTFEPNPTNYRHLLHHISINNLHHVFPLPWAVGQSTGVTEFFTNLDNDGGHALWNPGLHPFNEKTRTQQVQKHLAFMISLDDFFRGSGPGAVKLIKIDTEGNEFNVLRSSRAFLQNAQVPAIIAEVNRFGLSQLSSSEQELRSFMGELGYTPYLLVGTPPTRLAADQFLEIAHVFNILFVSSALQAMVADKWPQETVVAAPSVAADKAS